MSNSDFHKISLKDVRIGSPILWNVYDANGRLLARIGFVPQSEKQLETLIECGLFADAGEYKKTNTTKHLLKAINKKPEHHVLSLMGNALGILQNVTLGFVAHAPIPDIPEVVMQVVGILNETITTQPDIALACIHFKQSAEGYANRHLIDAAILSIMVARAMQLPTSEVESIAAAALTMNIGMLILQEDLQNRAEPPTYAERVLIRKHPELSVVLLKEAGVNNPIWLAHVLSHHEHFDGSGYPAGLSAEKIADGAKVIALADRYTAMIAPRKFRKAIHPVQALHSLVMDNDKNFDPKITAFFSDVLGTYPPGSCVKLASGEVAVVMSKGNPTATTPSVKVIKNPLGEALPYPEYRKTGTEQFAIKEEALLEAQDIPFTMEQLWGLEAT
jgi:HD-GYP domain-containing protein (c-di-GMP phosphodiesterase class II)